MRRAREPVWLVLGRSRHSLHLAVITIALAAGAIGRGAPVASVYEVVPEESRAIINVGKAGALSFIAGHTHEVEAPIRGTLAVDPAHPEAGTVALEIEAADLRVTGEGEPPEDVPEVQKKMVSAAVLDVARYPTITFRSKTMAAGSQRGAAIDLSVTGELTLHGETKPITVPVRAELTTNRIAAHGTFSVEQTDYGITPVSVGGVVSVRDVLAIRFTIVAAH
ncbi:MAG: YceI family protein [Vicinamibacterales bacterium]